MKIRNIITFIAISALLFSCGEKPLKEGTYRISGTVKGLEDGEIYTRNSSFQVDTITIKNGKFLMEGELKDKVGMVALAKDPTARIMNAKEMLSLFIEPTSMKLVLDYNDMSQSKLTGSATQADNDKLEGITNEIASKYEKEVAEFDLIREKYNKAAAAGASEEELEKIKYEDNEARGKLSPMWDQQSKATLQFMKENPKSYISAYRLLFRLGGMKYNEAKAIYDNLDPSHLKTPIGKQLTQRIEELKKGVPGAIAGNFDTIDINGQPIKLADFKGQYLLVDFWASWCVPCRKGNPHLLDLYAKYKSKGLEILGVSDDDSNPKAWRKAVQKDKIGVWRHVLRGIKIKNGKPDYKDKSTDISEGYNISSLPTKILIGPDGVIVGRYGGGGGSDADMDRDLAKIFDQ